jgi:hypothetical protein
VAAEEQRQRDLQNLLTYLQSPTFQERQARLELGLKKNGERVLVVPPNATDTPSTATKTSPATTADTPAAETSNPSRWWHYLLRK